MEKQDILDYVSKTPENINVNVLGGMLDEFVSGGGGGGGLMKVTITAETVGQDVIVTLHNTYKEILDAYNSGKQIVGEMTETYQNSWVKIIQGMRGIGYNEDSEKPYFVSMEHDFACANENDYPTYITVPVL